jgi:hypothetical protein
LGYECTKFLHREVSAGPDSGHPKGADTTDEVQAQNLLDTKNQVQQAPTLNVQFVIDNDSTNRIFAL